MNRLTALAAALAVIVPTTAIALTKESRLLEDRSDDWSAGASCVLRYYNICTGWVWVWGNFEDGERFGVVSSGCCGASETALLQQNLIFVSSSAPHGWGYTGSISVHALDAANCPIEPPIATQPYLPRSVFQVVSWGGVVVPSPFAVVVTFAAGDNGFPNHASFGSDRPAAGPTGPQACGVCYPANRVTHSFLYGTAAAPLCPGDPFNDGICNAELFWDFTFVCPTPIEESSWGKLKTLYK